MRSGKTAIVVLERWHGVQLPGPLLLVLIYLFRDSLKQTFGPEVGVFILIVLVIIGTYLAWTKAIPFQSHFELHAVFKNAANIRKELGKILPDGNPRQQMLLALEDANAFVVSLDAQRTWFRYHRMFGGLLRRARRVAVAGPERLHFAGRRIDGRDVADRRERRGDLERAADAAARNAASSASGSSRTTPRSP